MDDVRPYADVHGDGNLEVGARGEQGKVPVLEAGGGQPQGQSGTHGLGRSAPEGVVHESPCFVRHAETAVVQAFLDVLAGFALIAQFEVMDGSGAIKSNGGEDAFAHGVDENRVEADLDGVRAHHQNNGASGFDGGGNGGSDFAEILHCQKCGQGVEEGFETRARYVGAGEGFHGDLVGAIADGEGADF